MTAGSDWTANFGAFTYHGGALEVARRLTPDATKPWIDLSTGISPHAYPLPDLKPEAWSRLPESGALAELEAVAAQRYNIAAESVVAGAGSQALIQALSHILPAGAVTEAATLTVAIATAITTATTMDAATIPGPRSLAA